MIVVADTSPLNYLIQIDCDNLLPQIYGRIVLPTAVIAELGDLRAPARVRAWLARRPDWIEVASAGSMAEAELTYLGKGEKEAIQIAMELKADLLLIDERKGRIEAKRRGLRTTGTLGVLLTAGELSLIDPQAVYRKLLLETSFRTSKELESEFLGEIR